MAVKYSWPTEKKESQPRRKAPPPRWENLTPGEAAPSTARKMEVQEKKRGKIIGRASEGISED